MQNNHSGGILPEPGSFRDRHGRIVYYQDRVYRYLNQVAAGIWQQFQEDDLYQQLHDAGLVVTTEAVSSNVIGEVALQAPWKLLLRHEKIPVISYPYEWPFSMLKEAALLQLRLMQQSLRKNWILKDATSFNVQWFGAKPVFIDIPSFKPLGKGEPWEGYQQFCRLFLYPLMLQSYKGMAYHGLLKGDIDGIDPVDMAAMMSFRDGFRSGVLSHVVLQAKLQKRHSASDRQVKKDLKSAGFNKAMIENNVNSLVKLVSKLTVPDSGSEWSDYTQLGHYDDDSRRTKHDFVGRVAATRNWHMAWDIGCNTGEYARILAEYCDCVVAMDADTLAVDRLYRKLSVDEDRRILPLVVNLKNPSPSLGWDGTERKTLQQRSSPELVCCLALIHHIVITANVPLAEFIKWLAKLDSVVVIEFVSKQDPMVQTLLRNKEDIYDDYDVDFFEQQVQRYFRVVEQQVVIPDQRTIYHLVPA